MLRPLEPLIVSSLNVLPGDCAIDAFSLIEVASSVLARVRAIHMDIFVKGDDTPAVKAPEGAAWSVAGACPGIMRFALRGMPAGF
jgi:hypothetical protein